MGRCAPSTSCVPWMSSWSRRRIAVRSSGMRWRQLGPRIVYVGSRLKMAARWEGSLCSSRTL